MEITMKIAAGVFIFGVVLYAVITLIETCCPLEDEDGPADRSGGTTVPRETADLGVSAVVVTLVPRDSQVRCPTGQGVECPMLKIIRCRDRQMWYADKVGQTVPMLGRWPEGWVSREPSGMVNLVKFEDAELIGATK